eukprot:CAMPEP_0176104244 /NCGR_PEP_ID=MMETSP0120_2-20121206/52307_1 /TAXON_ID=160619 /ORGANISM="Kryptoperidinium foliaceum, Strain CCMP 1326" /LENGTH=456 /DNA_ID=CAMNT_0017438347 /DNA_START=89 /DNA_END=1455 /DNA_ORIENTATION=+
MAPTPFACRRAAVVALAVVSGTGTNAAPGARPMPLLQQRRRATRATAVAVAPHDSSEESGALQRRVAGASLLGVVSLRSAAAGAARAVSVDGVARAATERTAGSQPRLSAGFFDSFSNGESTYDEDSDRGRNPSEAGWEPGYHKPASKGKVSAEWFDESVSGGPEAAWQTHFPGMKTDLKGQGANNADWVEDDAGHWHQPYADPFHNEYSTMDGNPFAIRKSDQEIPAGFFDDNIAHYDSYGRRQAPLANSGRRFVDWQETAVNTSLACKTPGCVASTSLQAFDGKTQLGRHCRLNVDALHYSGSSIEWISVNGANVSSRCAVPAANHCNGSDSEKRSLYPCVFDLDLEKLMPSTGTLEISAKILPNAPTDCTYQGNLLSMVPMVTCMVKDMPEPSAVGAYASSAITDMEDAAPPTTNAVAAPTTSVAAAPTTNATAPQADRALAPTAASASAAPA